MFYNFFSKYISFNCLILNKYTTYVFSNKESLVNSVDELIDLVDKWNTNNCYNPSDPNKNKKRLYSNTNMIKEDSKSDEMPIKKTKVKVCIVHNFVQKILLKLF